MPRVFVMGDIHGAYMALKQCLQRTEFDYEHDTLISLGDVCDGWPQTKDCIDELLKIKKLIYILGNHDLWALEWMKGNPVKDIWLTQGGEATIKSYEGKVPESHINFLDKALPYYIHDNKLFVHAGIDIDKPLSKQGLDIFLWDRTLAHLVLNSIGKDAFEKLTPFDEVYLGHTPVSFGRPVRAYEVWLMDTGAGWSGPLTLMDIKTKEIFVSDNVPAFYPGMKGRRNK
jgi:serine/threonine protein phosphatase 1